MRTYGRHILLLVLAQVSCSSAFSPASVRRTIPPAKSTSSHAASPTHRIALTKRYGSQWDDSDDSEEVTTKATSFDQAGENLKKEDDEEKLNSVGDFDANPSYSTDSADKIRAAIKQRANKLGIEESKEQIEYRKRAEERAKEARENFVGGGTDQMQQLLDLSKISNDAPGGKMEDGVPTIFYDPEDEMTPEEKAEADPTGELPILQQGLEVIKKGDFPSFGAATVEVFTLVFSIIATASLFIGYDYVIRNVYEWTNILPTEEERRIGIEQREKRMQLKQANDKDLMESLKNFEQDVPTDL